MHPTRLYLALSALAGCTLLYLVPPETSHLYPPCPIHAFTGLLCPGCGATRALAALLHGHFRQAFHLNALFVLLLPLALVYTLTQRRTLPTPALTLLTLATAIFTITRNLP